MSSLKTRILVDTTYLLPVLGVEVKGVRRALERIRELYERNRVELYYSPFSILEALGKISKTRYDPLRVEGGLIAIIEWGCLILHYLRLKRTCAPSSSGLGGLGT